MRSSVDVVSLWSFEAVGKSGAGGLACGLTAVVIRRPLSLMVGPREAGGPLRNQNVVDHRHLDFGVTVKDPSGLTARPFTVPATRRDPAPGTPPTQRPPPRRSPTDAPPHTHEPDRSGPAAASP